MTAYGILNMAKAPRVGISDFQRTGSFARGIAGSARTMIPDGRSESVQWAEAYYVLRHHVEGVERLRLSDALLAQLESA